MPFPSLTGIFARLIGWHTIGMIYPWNLLRPPTTTGEGKIEFWWLWASSPYGLGWKKLEIYYTFHILIDRNLITWKFSSFYLILILLNLFHLIQNINSWYRRISHNISFIITASTFQSYISLILILFSFSGFPLYFLLILEGTGDGDYKV